MSVLSGERDGARAHLPALTTVLRRRGASAVLVVFLLSVVSRLIVGQVTDVSWLIIVCEKIIGGAQLYVDILETNPPFSVALYFGPVWLSHQVGLSPEAMVELYVYALWLVSMALLAAVVERGPVFGRWHGFWFYPAIALLTLVLPGKAFGQREHIGMMLFLPMLALMMWRADVRAPRAPTGLALVVGLAASVLVLVKPHWGLGIALPYAVICWRRRSLRALFMPENLMIGVVASAYLVVVIAFFPVYVEALLPILMKYYVSARDPWNLLIAGPTFAIFLTFIWHYREPDAADGDIAVAVAAATGFFISVVILGKYWTNHQYPHLVCLSLATFMTVVAWLRSPQRSGREPATARIGPLAGLVAVCALCVGTHDVVRPDAGALQAIRARFDAPTILQVGNDLAVGNPLTREVNGRWISRYAHDWIGENALASVLQGAVSGQARKAAMETVREHTAYIDDLMRQDPDIVLLGKAVYEPTTPLWESWMLRDPLFSAMLERNYSEIYEGLHARVFARKGAGRASGS